MNEQDKKRIRLGDEYDNNLKNVLINVLKELGGKINSRDWGVGGSQEIEITDVEINGHLLTIESETYIGLLIAGKGELVDKISSIVRSRLAK